MNDETKKDGIVEIHGLEYQTVALRVTNFREQHPDWTIETEVIDPGMYITVKATIRDNTGRVIATGHASEERGGRGINMTSALENCETSAVGRALAFYKYPGQFLRSADEMNDALIQQGIKQVQKDYGERMMIIRDIAMLQKIVDLKDRLADGDFHAAAEIMLDMKEDELYALRLAPTKGGIMTTKEIELLKSNEYAEARNSITGFKSEK